MKVTLIGLGGMQPLLNPELLPENAATLAQASYAHSWTRKAELEAAQTLEEVEAA